MRKKEVYLSILRIISAFAVVLIHTNARFCWETDVTGCFNVGNLIDCVCSFAVPVFIMISGATLLNYSERYSTKEYLIKRITKTLLPYIIWSLLGGMYEKITGHEGVFFVYYFFLNLFGVYLTIPLFTFIRNDLKEKVILYVIIISFVLNYLLPFICFTLDVNYIYKIPFEIGDNYLIYVLIGYLISKCDVPIWGRVISYIFAGLGVLIQYVSAFDIGVTNNLLRAYTSLPCFFYAVGIFIFIKQIGRNIASEKEVRLIDFLGEYTYAVYLLHWYMIDVLVGVLMLDYHNNTARILVSIITFIICIIVASIIKKVPVLKRILP